MTGFLQWVSQAQNSALVLVIITGASAGLTGVYVVLTHSMSRAMSQQTSAMLHPVLMLTMVCHEEEADAYGQKHRTDTSPVGFLTIQNVGTQPAVLLDVRIECLSGGKCIKVAEYSMLEQHVLYPTEKDRIINDFDFSKALTPSIRCSKGYSYSFRVVAADLSQHEVVEYELLPVLGTRYFRRGMPLNVRWKRLKQRLYWRLMSIKRLLRLEAH